MRYTMNFKSLILGSAFVLSLFGLTACGDDSSSGADEGTSSAEEYIASSASEKSPFSEKSTFDAKKESNGKGGDALHFSGNLDLDQDFADNEYGEETWFTQFDSIQITATKLEGDKTFMTNISFNDKTVYPTDKITGNNIDKIDLDQLDTCGKFRLFVWMFMSIDCQIAEDADACAEAAAEDSLHFTAVKTFDFEKQCKVEISSSSVAEVCTELTPVDTTLSNEYGSSVYTFNFDGGADPQITMSIENSSFYFNAADGVEIWEEGSQETGLRPEGNICAEKLETIRGSMENPKLLNNGIWLLIKTPGGDYPVLIGTKLSDGSKGWVSFTYYKK